MNLAWDPSPDASVVGYVVRYSTTSRQYNNSTNVGLATTSTISGLQAGATYYFAVFAVNQANLESDPSNEVGYTVPAPTPPSISLIADGALSEDASTSVAFTVSSASIPAGNLAITASSSNPSLIPVSGIVLGGSGSNRTAAVTPVANRSGAATLTLTVSDGSLTSSRNFIMTVNPVNDAPTLNPIANLAIAEGAGTQTASLSGISSGANDEVQFISVTATSSNPSLIPNPTVSYTSPDSTGSLLLEPQAGGRGSSWITVTVSDGQSESGSVSRTFNVGVGVSGASTLYVEAESASLTSPMTVTEDTNAAGGKYVYTETDYQGTASYALTIAEAGDYVIWWRVLSPDGGSDSLFVSVDGAAETAQGTAQNTWSTHWQWTLVNQDAFTARVFPLSAGAHTLTIRGRERFTKLDALYLTTDRNFIPGSVPDNAVPTLNALADLSLDEDAGTQVVDLTGINSGSSNESQTLTVTVSSSDPAIVADPVVTYTSPDSTGTLTFNPAPNANGTCTMTVTVNDGQPSNNLLTRSFAVVVTPVNDAPTLAALSDVTTVENSGTQTVSLLGISSGASDEAQLLIVTATSSNPSLIPNPTVSYTSPDSTGSLLLEPQAGGRGSSLITVTVSDGQSESGSVSRTFNVGVGVSGASTLYVEAESASLTSPMTVAEDTNAAGGKYVYTETDYQGTASYALTIAEAGDYVIWWRVLSPDGGSDSLFVSVDGAVETAQGTAQNTWSTNWQWTRINQDAFTARVFPLSAGAHTLTIRGRERFTKLDALYLTTDRNFIPGSVPDNAVPTLNALADLSLDEDAGTQVVDLTGISSGSSNESQTLTVTVSSSDPAIVADPVVTYTSPDSTGTLTFNPAPNANGTCTVTVTVNDGQPSNNLLTRSFAVVVTPVNDAPTLAALSDVTTVENSGTQTVSLLGISSGASDEAQLLIVTATSSNPSLIPNPTVSYTSPDSTGSLLLEPQAGGRGSSLITVTVSDGQSESGSVSRTFNVGVGVSGASTLYVEAESASLTSPMTVAEDTNAAGGKYVYTETDYQGTASYALTIAEAGDYVIWWRVLSPDGGSDSLFVSVDGAVETAQGTAQNTWSTNWQWTLVNQDAFTARVFPLSAGAHTLTIRGRERFTKLDALYLTTDRNFIPADSPRAFVGVAASMLVVAAASEEPDLTKFTSGTYRGLFYPSNEVGLESSGEFTLSVTERGAYTGHLRTSAGSMAFDGKLDDSGHATNLLVQVGSAPVTIQFVVNEAKNQIDGEILGSGWVAVLLGDHAGPEVSGNLTPLEGIYSLQLAWEEDPALSLESVMKVTITTNGTATLVGQLPDGSTFVHATAVSANGDVPVFVSLYGGRGLLIGWLRVTDGEVTGLIHWMRASNSSDSEPNYSGFSFEANVIGTRVPSVPSVPTAP